jgi:hypothetical protein
VRFVVLLALTRVAFADGIETRVDGDAPVSAGASVGAGAQGDAMYEALELRFDAAWRELRVALDARVVWLDGHYRHDFAHPADAVAAIRDVEWRDGDFALAAGALAPSQVAHVADGYRAELDDHFRTGVRMRYRDVGLEIDDVLDPAVIAGSANVTIAGPWRALAAAAIDPAMPDGAVSGPAGPRASASTMTSPAGEIELGLARRIAGDRARLDVGGSVVGEPGFGGVSGVAFVDAATDRGGARWTARADVRAGTASDALFGPLYRAERAFLRDRDLAGVSAGASAGVATPVAWADVGVRHRAGIGGLVVASAGAPLGRVQAGGWLAIARDAQAGAAEVKVAWDRRLATAVSLSRMLGPMPAWSLVAWFGATI